MQSDALKPLRWLYVDLNSFFASVEQQEHPALAGRPVVVTPVASEFTSAIAVSYEAKSLGVRNGMRVRDIRMQYPEVAVLCARHDVYVAYSQRIFAEIERHLPVTKIGSVDEAACRLMGRDMDQAAALQAGRTIQQALKRNIGSCIRCSIGIAPSHLLAKMASDMQKPMGLTILPASRLPQAILHLPLSDIPGIGRRMEGRLARAGCTSMEGFWSLSPVRARAIWGGIEGERVWYGLHGIDPPEREERPHRSISHSAVLPRQHSDLDGARMAARNLLLLAATRLRKMKYKAQGLGIFLVLTAGGKHFLECRFPPADDSFYLLGRFDPLWVSAGLSLTASPIKRVGIALTNLLGPDLKQADMFDALDLGQPSQTGAVSQAMDRINQRFGRNTLHIGPTSSALSQYAGAKIAFNRIPDATDFN